MTGEGLSALHWHTLKSMVEKAGGKYENKEQSIAFLAGGPVSPVAVPGVLDKSRDYGLVYGQCDEYPGATFSQGGFLFNALGEKLDGQVVIS